MPKKRLDTALLLPFFPVLWYSFYLFANSFYFFQSNCQWDCETSKMMSVAIAWWCLITVCATFYFCIFTDSDKELLCLLLLAVSWDREHYQRKIGIYFDIHILFIYCIQKEYCLYSKLHPKVQKFFSILKKYFCPQRAKSLHIYCEVSFKW